MSQSETPVEIPDKPSYASSSDEALDEALEDAIAAAKRADDSYLENLLTAELGSLRYEHL